MGRTRNKEKDQVLSVYEDEMDIFQVYLEDLGYSTNTINSYLDDVRIFFTFMHNKTDTFPTVSSIDKRDIQEFLRKFHRGKKKSTRNRRLMALRTFFKSLIKADIVKHNPALEVDTAKQERNPIPVYLEDRELKALLNSVKPDEHHLRNKAILMLMALCGLRVVEVHNLNVTDLIRIPENPGLRVLGKGSKHRYIPLPFQLYEILLDYERLARPKPQKGSTNAFFLSRTGRRLSRRRIQEIVEESIHELKNKPEFLYLHEKGLSAHKLRHTFGTRLVKEGVDLVTIQELMGHANLNTTQIYTHVNDKQKEKAMRSGNVDQFF